MSGRCLKELSLWHMKGTEKISKRYNSEITEWYNSEMIEEYNSEVIEEYNNEMNNEIIEEQRVERLWMSGQIRHSSVHIAAGWRK